jgi:hypothetical protein
MVAAAVASSGDGTWEPAAGSIVIRTDPRHYVSDAEAVALEQRGEQVRSIPGTEYSIWYSNFEEFVAALPEVFR